MAGDMSISKIIGNMSANEKIRKIEKVIDKIKVGNMSANTET